MLPKGTGRCRSGFCRLVCASLLATAGFAQTTQPTETPQAGSTQPAQKPATPPPTNRQIPSLVGGPTTPPQAPPGPPHKTPPAAKTNDEFAAYNAAVSNPDIGAAEKSADDFATKFTQSDLRGLLYSAIMRRYQQANDPEKTLEMARKVLTYEPNDPVALVMAATVLAERTREGDLDREERYDEAVKYAQKSLDTVNTDLMVPSNAGAEQINSAKKVLQSMAHSAIGMVQLDRKNDAAASQEFQQSIALSVPGQVEPLTYLRLALAQDHLKQYPEALISANKAVEVSPANSPVAMLAKQEVDRLTELSKAGAPGAGIPAPEASTNAVPPASKPPSEAPRSTTIPRSETPR